jgi:hypothetical protein
LKKQLKNIIKILIILSILFLPFIYITELIGIDIFLDSFENPKHYMCIQSDGLIFGSKSDDNDLIILQKTSHPDFFVNKNDFLLYFTDEGFIEISRIVDIKYIGSREKYYKEPEEKMFNFPIFKEQIIGKVINIFDDNILNSISLKIWEASINNLNIRALTN